MTNEEKQKQKPRASTVPPETRRYNIKGFQPSLSDDEIAAIEQFQYILDRQLRGLKDGYGLTAEEMYDLLRPYLSGPNVVSKIGVLPGCKVTDQRHVNLKLMVAMYRVFGISIDELLAECFQSLPERQPPTK